jgi:hypothetical protein
MGAKHSQPKWLLLTPPALAFLTGRDCLHVKIFGASKELEQQQHPRRQFCTAIQLLPLIIIVIRSLKILTTPSGGASLLLLMSCNLSSL